MRSVGRQSKLYSSKAMLDLYEFTYVIYLCLNILMVYLFVHFIFNLIDNFVGLIHAFIVPLYYYLSE